MSDRSIQIGIILSAYDRMSAVINRTLSNAQTRLTAFQTRSNQIADKALGIGTGGIAAGAGATALLYKPITAFAELEDAGMRMKATLMRDGGIVPEKLFKNLNNEAIALGNKLPGTTADFQNLYATMLQQGTSANSILSGTGKAAAYLAVALRIPTEQAGILASRIRLQLGVADKDMMQFMDMMQRINGVGIDPNEMQYAFARSSGALKLLNYQGLEAGKSMGALFSLLIGNGGGQTGETAGSGFSKIMSEILNPTKVAKFNAVAKQYGMNFNFMRNGKFVGTENFVAQLSQLSRFDPKTINKILLPLTGGDGVDNGILATLIKAGPAGLNKMTKALADQASLEDRVNLQLGSLSNKWEAASGTFTNSLAAFGGTFAPILNKFADTINNVSEKLSGLIERHRTLFKWIGYGVMIFSTIATVIGVFGFAVYGVTKYTSLAAKAFSVFGKAIEGIQFLFFALRYYLVTAVWPTIVSGLTAMWGGIVSATTAVWGFTTALLANPITWIIAAVIALAVAAYLIYQNWDPITKWFSKQWLIIKAQMSGAAEVANLLIGIFSGLGKVIVGAFTFNPAMVISGMKQVASTADKVMSGGIGKAYNKGYSAVMDGQPGSKSASPKLQTRSSSPTFHAHITLNGGATPEHGRMIAETMEQQFKRLMKNHQERQRAVSYNPF